MFLVSNCKCCSVFSQRTSCCQTKCRSTTTSNSSTLAWPTAFSRGRSLGAPAAPPSTLVSRTIVVLGSCRCCEHLCPPHCKLLKIMLLPLSPLTSQMFFLQLIHHQKNQHLKVKKLQILFGKNLNSFCFSIICCRPGGGVLLEFRLAVLQNSPFYKILMSGSHCFAFLQ